MKMIVRIFAILMTLTRLCSSISLDFRSVDDADNDRQQRFLATTSTMVVSSIVATVTSTLTTFPSCFLTANNIPLCSSTILTGRRKKRNGVINENPITEALTNDGKVIDLREIQASRVDRQSRQVMPTKTEDIDFDTGFQIFSVVGLPLCSSAETAEGRTGRNFITFHTTSTSRITTTSTQTIINAATQTLNFNTAAPGQCFPSALLSSLNVPKC